MAFCTSCGAQNEDSSKFCIYCGAKLDGGEPAQPVLNEQPPEHIYQSTEPRQPAQPTYQQTSYQQPSQPVQPDYQQQSYGQPGSAQYVPAIPTGGLLAWSIVTLLLCTIPGIVALVQTLGINKCATVEEQQKKMKNAKIWCIVGAVLGILAVIGQIAGNS